MTWPEAASTTRASRDSAPVTVVMATFNGEKFITKQLCSILAQTRPPDRLVIADDASSDNTLEIVNEVLASASFPSSIIDRDRNIGLRQNLEGALRQCESGIIVLADQDDIWLPTKLEVLSAAFDDPEVTVWWSDAELIDEHGRGFGRRVWEATRFGAETRKRVDAGDGFERLVHGMTVVGATMAFRSTLLAVALPFPDRLEGADHLYFHDGWITVLGHLAGRIVSEPQALTLYRQHQAQQSAMSMTGGVPSELLPSEVSTARAAAASALELDLARVRLVADRLREVGASTSSNDGRLAEVFAREAFLSDRAGEGTEHLRPRRVVHHLVKGDYHRYAGGARSFFKDGYALGRSCAASGVARAREEACNATCWIKERLDGKHIGEG